MLSILLSCHTVPHLKQCWRNLLDLYVDVLILVKGTEILLVAKVNRFIFVLLLLDLVSKFRA